MIIGRLTLLLAILVVTAPSVAGPAEDLYKAYLQSSRGTEFREMEARLGNLRKLCALEDAPARGLLLKVFRTAKSRDDRLLAVTALGERADLATQRVVAKKLESKAEPEQVRAWAKGLARTKDDAVIAWLGGEALEASKPVFLQACAHALAQHPGHAAAEPLIALYEKHSGNRRGVDIAHEAVRALGAASGEGAIATVLAATEHKDWRIRLAAAEVLPRQERDNGEILAAIRKLMGDPYAVVRQIAALNIGVSKLEPLVPELIHLLDEDPRMRTRHAAYVALKAISGCDYHFDAATWREWWKSRQKGLDARAMTFARYYGFSVQSDRILFVVDLSGSMRWDGGYSVSRLDAARSELIAVLKELPETCSFNLLVYSDKVAEWQKKEVDASPANVKKAVKWIEHQFKEPDGDTHTYEALELAFKRNPEFDTLYFLSDGVPSHGPYVSHEGILASVEVWNRYRRAVIHTFALTFTGRRPDLVRKYVGERNFMGSLASGTGGEFRVIRKPPR